MPSGAVNAQITGLVQDFCPVVGSALAILDLCAKFPQLSPQFIQAIADRYLVIIRCSGEQACFRSVSSLKLAGRQE